MNVNSIILFTVLAFGSAAHAGEILRCVAADGAVMYTNLGCPANTQSHHVSNYEPVQDSPPAARDLAAEEAAISARLAEEAAERAEAAAYHQASYYEAPAEPERGGPYHQYEDNNVYYPAYFGGYPLLGAGFPNHHAGHRDGMQHTAFSKTGRNGNLHGVHPQPVRPPIGHR